MNKRKDEYGGSTENRIRLSVKVAKAVGDEFTVGIRISQGKVNDHHHKWAGKEKDASIIFEQLGITGIDFFHVTENMRHGSLLFQMMKSQGSRLRFS